MYLDSSANSNWLYPWLWSNLLKTFAPDNRALSSSSVGVAYHSFLMALFTDYMPTQTVTFPGVLLSTITIRETQEIGALAFSIIPSSSSFQICCLMCFCT